MAGTTSKALPYHEPGIVTILIDSSFLIALNIINYVLDRAIYCGLLGQIFIGMAWGIPGANWLDMDFQNVAQSVGYLGLILLVYEGGLSTSLRALKANLILSIAVALTGIGLPMGFSFSLTALASATPLQAFAAGAALCSTSLGTTFTILNTSGLARTKLGTVLTSAAMMDDVVGLVLVQVISNLGRSTASFSSVTVIRPLAVSFGFVIVLLACCRLLVAPVTRLLQSRWKRDSRSFLFLKAYDQHVAFLVHTMVLIGLVTGATYAGTSGLFAAYLAGASISWWDSEFLTGDSDGNGSSATTAISAGQGVESAPNDSTSSDKREPPPSTAASEAGRVNQPVPDRGAQTETTNSEGLVDSTQPTGLEVYEVYYSIVVDRILKPLFFASIGFAIPISEMFRGAIVWRGIVYTILMFIGKVLTGLWLMRLEFSGPGGWLRKKWKRSAQFCCLRRQNKSETPVSGNRGHPSENHTAANSTPSTVDNQRRKSPPPGPAQTQRETKASPSTSSRWPKPRSLYPASIVGIAMVARGEIGFLIASLGESNGIYAGSSSTDTQSKSTGASETYLIVTWAVMLCTIIGPLAVGMLVRRLKRLQRQREVSGGPDPLGVWGVL